MTQVVEKKKTLGKRECARIYKEADAAGHEAATTVVPTPMIVGTPTTPLGNDIDFTKKTYFVEGGACGFAWVKIFPARGAFVNYLKSIKVGSTNGYEGGYDVWVSGFGQSVTRKEAYAQAFAAVLRKYGINAYGQSRLD
jgi:hypothetical protein